MADRYRTLAAAVSRALNDADPIGLLQAGAPLDEYDPETSAILPRVTDAQDVGEVTDVLHEEFVRWFDENTAGPRHAYEAPARQIWDALLEFRKNA